MFVSASDESDCPRAVARQAVIIRTQNKAVRMFTGYAANASALHASAYPTTASRSNSRRQRLRNPLRRLLQPFRYEEVQSALAEDNSRLFRLRTFQSHHDRHVRLY